MHISQFDYELPDELIAQQPADRRDAARMLAVDRARQQFTDNQFSNFPSFLRTGDLLVVNDTQVFPARLKGQRAGFTAQVEIFLVRHLGDDRWEALVKPGRALRLGYQAVFGPEQQLCAEVIEILPEGRRVVALSPAPGVTASVDQLIDQLGLTPLPPYIKREQPETLRLDQERYQTVYARERGAIAAPTAGLHFTPEVLTQIQAQGIEVVTITHHVGYGTFQPVRVEDIREHQLEAEHSLISAEAAERINRARARGGRIIAIGTTTTRALESAVTAQGEILPGRRHTDLFIYPSYQFRAIDALLTNFHLPKSSLLMLVSAFANRELVMAAYRHAVAERYRFYSYGDCMFLY